MQRRDFIKRALIQQAKKMHKTDEYHRKGAGKQKPIAGFLALSMIFTLYSLECAMKLE